MNDKNIVCPVCGGRVVYFVGDSQVVSVDCLSGCEMNEEQKRELIDMYPISEEMMKDIQPTVEISHFGILERPYSLTPLFILSIINIVVIWLPPSIR